MESNTLFYLLINVLKATPDIDYDNQVLYILVQSGTCNEDYLYHNFSFQLNEKYKAALDTISDLERRLEAAKKQEAFYVEKCQTLEKNISLLYVTAKAELQRKDSQIEELR